MGEDRKIHLSGKYATGDCSFTLVDADVYEMLEMCGYKCRFQFKRVRKKDGRRVGYVMCEARNTGKRRRIFLHHLVLGLTSLPAGMVVDHLNGDTLDNRRSNLQICNLTHNARNRLAMEGRSGRRGIRVIEGRYVPIIKYRGHTLSLGRYQNLDDAARTWDFLTLLLDERSAARHTNFPASNYKRRLETFRAMQRCDCPGCYD